MRAIRWFVMIIAPGLLGLALATPVHGDPTPPGAPGRPGGNRSVFSVTRVAAGTDGVTIYIQVVENQPGATGSSVTSQGSSASTARCEVFPANIGNASFSGFQAAAAAHPGQTPYVLYCDGVFQGIVWLPATTDPSTVRVQTDFGDAVDPASLARTLLEQVPMPPIRLAVNPATGLVALRSWFWVEGYDGAPIRHAATLAAVTVEVELTPTGYSWDFGNGESHRTTSLGQAYPRESDIGMTYERSSLQTTGGYPVAMAVSFSVRFRVNAGAWQSLPPVSRAFATLYPVQQVQAVLTGR